LELARKYNLYEVIIVSFRPAPATADPQRVIAVLQELIRANPPFAVPPTDAAGQWAPYMQAEVEYKFREQMKQPANPATVALGAMLEAYTRNDVATFNKQLGNYRVTLANYERSLEENAKQLKTSGVAKSEVYSAAK
jgi:hypothetical protein